MLWSTVSKAFFRSKNRNPLIRPLSIFRYQLLLVASSRAVKVEFIGLKPCREPASKLLLFTYSQSWLKMTFLIILLTIIGRMDMGLWMLGSDLMWQSSLYKGNTLEICHLSGKYPLVMDKCTTCVREGMIYTGPASFKSLTEMPSNPLYNCRELNINVAH